MLTREEKLFAVASLAVLVTHVLGDTGEPTLGAGNLGLGIPPRLLGAGLDVVVQQALRPGQDLFGRASGLRVTGKAMVRRFLQNLVPMPLSVLLGGRWRARQDSNLRPSA